MRYALLALAAAALLGCAKQAPPKSGAPADLAAAAPETLRARCGEGDGPSCTALGVRVERGMLHDGETAASFFERGCDYGDANGCNNLGRLLHDGKGVPVDLRRAGHKYARGCNLGSAEACSNLGNLYEDGLGMPEDVFQAHELYSRACAAGFGPGCRHEGRLLENGNGGFNPESPAEARAAYNRGCGLGDPGACVSLGILVREGRGGPVDFARARELFTQACRQGFVEACERTGTTLPENPPPR